VKNIQDLATLTKADLPQSISSAEHLASTSNQRMFSILQSIIIGRIFKCKMACNAKELWSMQTEEWETVVFKMVSPCGNIEVEPVKHRDK